MEDWAEIRRLHRAEVVPIKEIARQLGLARNTVRAALRSDGPSTSARHGARSPTPTNRRCGPDTSAAGNKQCDVIAAEFGTATWDLSGGVPEPADRSEVGGVPIGSRAGWWRVLCNAVGWRSCFSPRHWPHRLGLPPTVGCAPHRPVDHGQSVGSDDGRGGRRPGVGTQHNQRCSPPTDRRRPQDRPGSTVHSLRSARLPELLTNSERFTHDVFVVGWLRVSEPSGKRLVETVGWRLSLLARPSLRDMDQGGWADCSPSRIQRGPVSSRTQTASRSTEVFRKCDPGFALPRRAWPLRP